MKNILIIILACSTIGLIIWSANLSDKLYRTSFLTIPIQCGIFLDYGDMIYSVETPTDSWSVKLSSQEMQTFQNVFSRESHTLK